VGVHSLCIPDHRLQHGKIKVCSASGKFPWNDLLLLTVC
jgi:hypothetical protein